MINDPREILRKVGVCPESGPLFDFFDTLNDWPISMSETIEMFPRTTAVAITALARGWADAEGRAAQFKWQLDHAECPSSLTYGEDPVHRAELNRLWEEHLKSQPEKA